jgi:hypothetical protein
MKFMTGTIAIATGIGVLLGSGGSLAYLRRRPLFRPTS